MPASELLISIIVPVRDDPHSLRECLLALEAQDFPKDSYEVLVVDDGSTVPIADAPSVRVIRQPPRGSYAARNEGIRHARGSILAFTDADCRPVTSWLSAAADAVTQNEGAAVAGPIDVPAPEDVSAIAVHYECRFAFPQQTYVERDHFGATANLIVPATLMAEVGPFDERLQSGGDWEWGQRARRAGVNVVYAPDVRVIHPPRTTVRALLRKNARVARGAVALARGGHYQRRQLIALWGSGVVPPVGDAARAMLDERSGPLHVRSTVSALRVLLWAQRLAILVAGRAWP